MKKFSNVLALLALLIVFLASCKKDGPYSGLSVSTNDPKEITDHTAVCGGRVSIPDEVFLTEVGVCWSTDINPTVSDEVLYSDVRSMPFEFTLTGLTPNTTYFVRAFVANDSICRYGSNRSFTTTLNGQLCWGDHTVLPGVFSVGENQRVRFAPGNLQYNAFEDVWRFAENQWDCIGRSNRYIGQHYGGWIDLFGWGTSGYNTGAQYYQPWETGSVDGYYNPYGYDSSDLFDKDGRADWGYNAICNGGDMEGIWSTLSRSEWDYLLNSRQTFSGIRYAKATVAGVSGVILLPDDWRSYYYYLSMTNQDFGSFTWNIIPAGQWNALEQHGAVFLPCSGYRHGTTCSNSGYAYYWSASHDTKTKAFGLLVNDISVYTDHSDYRSKGYAVRLVHFVN